jgi:hypothetical protein
VADYSVIPLLFHTDLSLTELICSGLVQHERNTSESTRCGWGRQDSVEKVSGLIPSYLAQQCEKGMSVCVVSQGEGRPVVVVSGH